MSQLRKEHDHHVDQALRCLIQASEALLTPTSDGKASALIYSGLALLHIAKADPDQKAANLVLPLLEKLKRSREAG